VCVFLSFLQTFSRCYSHSAIFLKKNLLTDTNILAELYFFQRTLCAHSVESAINPNQPSSSDHTFFCPPKLLEFDKLPEECDDQLFHQIVNNRLYTYHQLQVPPQSTALRHTSDTIVTTDQRLCSRLTALWRYINFVLLLLLLL